MNKNHQLIVAGCCSVFAALLHIFCIFADPQWYVFFGAGQQMADLAAAGDPYPTQVTVFIASILTIWGLYAFSGAGLIKPLPLLKTCLVIISAIYLIRGLAGFVLPFVTDAVIIQQNSLVFWMISSSVCLLFGSYYLLGTLKFVKAQAFTATQGEINDQLN